MPPLKLKRKKKDVGSLLLNHMRSRRTTFRLISPSLRPSPVVLLTSAKSTSTAVDNPTTCASTLLKTASDFEGKHKMEIKGDDQQTTTGGDEEEEEEWAGCVFEGDDDTPPIASESELPTLKSLGSHPATPMNDLVPMTQPEKDVVKMDEEVDEEVDEDEANSEDESEDESEDGGK